MNMPKNTKPREQQVVHRFFNEAAAIPSHIISGGGPGGGVVEMVAQGLTKVELAATLFAASLWKEGIEPSGDDCAEKAQEVIDACARLAAEREIELQQQQAAMRAKGGPIGVVHGSEAGGAGQETGSRDGEGCDGGGPGV